MPGLLSLAIHSVCFWEAMRQFNPCIQDLVMMPNRLFVNSARSLRIFDRWETSASRSGDPQMATSDNKSKQDLIQEILPDITDSEHEKFKEILGPDFESWSSVMESFIDGWKSGNDKLVKIVASEEAFQEKVGGYFT